MLSVSWSPPAASPSPGGGATAPPGPGQPPRCLSSNISRSRVALAASSSAPKPEMRGVPPAGRPATPQPCTRRQAKPRPLTRPHHGGALPRQVTPKTASTNERSRQPPGSAAPTEGRGAGAGAWGWLGAPGPSGEGGDAAQRGRRLPGARLPAEAQVGGEEGAGREAGSVTLFNASWGAGRLGPATPRPACGLRSRRPRPPHTFRRAPASRSQVTRRRPRPAPPLCAALRFPQPRLPPER